MGTASTLLVLISINLALGVLAGGSVGLGIALLQRSGATGWRAIAGGAIGGLLVGACAHMIGSDLFELLFGRSPGAITGAGEGVLLGAAVGAGLALSTRLQPDRLRSQAIPGFVTGGLAGLLIALAGGRLMAGSLSELAHRFPGSRLGIGQSGALLMADGKAVIAIATTVEAALFGGCVVCAILIARRLRDFAV